MCLVSGCKALPVPAVIASPENVLAFTTLPKHGLMFFVDEVARQPACSHAQRHRLVPAYPRGHTPIVTGDVLLFERLRVFKRAYCLSMLSRLKQS